MNVWAAKQKGFTIVELLIVIVVIAILAAITIVAYNGIQNRAKASAAQAAVTQAAKSVVAYAVQNSDTYPADQTAFDALSLSGNATYQYRADNDASPRTYCVTATTQNVSYFVSSTSGNPAAGACPGHGVNGVDPVINYVKRPYPNGSISGWTGYSSAGGTSASLTSNALNGHDAFRWTAGSAGFATSMTLGLEYEGTLIAVPGGASVTPSIYVRASKAGNFAVQGEFRNASGSVSSASGPTIAVAASTWVRLVVSSPVSVPVAADRMNIRARYVSGATWTSGDWIEVTNVSTAPGAYADGDSPGWAWSGAPNNSVSTGPQL